MPELGLIVIVKQERFDGYHWHIGAFTTCVVYVQCCRSGRGKGPLPELKEPVMTDIPSHISEPVGVEWVVLADHAEVLNSKLYLMGGGWETLTVETLPRPFRLALAVAFSIPWNETNKAHTLEVELRTEDGASLARIEGQLEVGRPPGIRPGQTQRVQMAATLELTFESLGTYEVVAGVVGGDRTSTTFTVMMPPGSQPR